MNIVCIFAVLVGVCCHLNISFPILMAETYLDLFTVLLSNADYVILSFQISHLSISDGQVYK